YVTGHSMGGFMSYRLAYDLSDMITAIAPVAGLAVQPAGEKPGHPVSILHQHAVDDTIVDLSGTMNGAYSMKESLEMWKNINGIKASPVTEKDRYGTLVRQWKDAEGGVEIRSILYQEGGHAWPIGATERAASFFYTHPSRETQLVMETQSETGIIHNMDPLVFHANISNPDSVKKVRLVSNGKEIQETDQSPFQLSFIPNMNTHYDMYMIAELADGSTVASINTVSCTICRKNIAQNAQVITSGDENDSLPGKHALDGNMRTRWSSEWDDDQYIQIDLGSKKTVSGFSLLWETAYGRAYELQVSDDGTEWSRVYQEDDSDGGTDFIAVDPVDTRHVRLIGKKRGTKWGYSLYEFMVHGS
ncbi:MAG: discoidin domain-containing protein, partial [Spirochaetota bacterium]